MHVHLIFNDWTCKVVVCEPQETQVVSVVWVDIEAVKHLLDVTGEGSFFLSESGQDANQGIELVWSLKQVPFALCCLQLVYWNLIGMAVIKYLFHKG